MTRPPRRLIGGPLDIGGERPEARRPSLTGWGIVAGLLLPVVGVVIAIILLARDRVGPGLAVLLASGAGLMIGLALLGM